MKNKICAALMVMLFSVTVFAQSQSHRQLVVQVPTGGFVSFKSETSAVNGLSNARSVGALINSQAVSGDNRIIHRVLTDGNQRVIFGYDLWINSDPVTRKFSLAVKPADDAFRRSFLKEGSTTRSAELFATFSESAAPRTLEDGDAVSVELLVNRESGLKIVDVVRVTFDRLRLFEKNFESAPRDFTLDAIALSMKSYELAIDGTVVAKRKSSVGYEGALLWFYVPDRGRFIVSLVPREGYNFQKSGIVEGNRIEFFAAKAHYEWISDGPILAQGGTWNLWVLHDKNYSPLFNPGEPAPKAEGPNFIDKLKEAITADTDTSGLGGNPGLPKAPAKSPETNPPAQPKIMVGSADNMENLLPKGN